MQYTFVYLNGIPWEPVWTEFRQRVQNIARELSEMGHPGVFVTGSSVPVPRVTRAAALGGQALTRAVRAYIESALLVPPVLPNLRVISPPGVPGVSEREIRRVFLAELVDSLRDQSPVLYYSTPFFWVEELDVVPETIPVIYDCADEYSAFSYASAVDLANENRLVVHSDLVFCSAHRLCVNKSQLNDRVYYVPNAVDPQCFEGDPPRPADIAELPQPLIGFVGGISEWVDLELVAQVAKAYPQCSVVLIGPVDVQLPDGFEEIPNLYLLGSRPYSQLHSYLSSFDVGLIPFKVNELTLSVSPLKLFEYFAAGLPTVSTNLPEVIPYRNGAFLARSRDEFVRLVGRALTAPPSRTELRQIAASETWRCRAEDILRILDGRDSFDFEAYTSNRVRTLCERYEEIVRAEPNPVTMVELCRLYWIHGDYDTALRWAQRATGPDYTGEEALIFLALGYIKTRRHEEAAAAVLEYADRCQEQDPVFACELRNLLACDVLPDFHLDVLRAVLLRRLRLYSEAITTLAELPPHPSVALQRAHLAFSLGEIDLALDLYSQIEDPWASAEFCNNMVELFRRLGCQKDVENALMSLARLSGLENYAEEQLAAMYMKAAFSKGSGLTRRRVELHRPASC